MPGCCQLSGAGRVAGSRRLSGRATGRDLNGACAVSGCCPGTSTDAGEAVGGRPEPSADLLGQLDDDPLRAADLAEPIAVFVALHLATSSAPRARKLATTASISSTANATWSSTTMPTCSMRGSSCARGYRHDGPSYSVSRV